ncbi:MAG: extracellular solute-binding protein, partial [Cellulosilyticaceae bacterium]
TKNDLVQTAFIEKQAGMFLDGSWVIGALKDMTDVEVFSVPAMPGSAGDGKEMVAGFTSGYYITKKAWDDPAKRQACIDYVKYMTSNDAIQLFVDNIGSVPAAPITPNGLSGLGEKGKVVKEAATKMSAPIDSWFSPTGYKYIISQVPLLATGKADATAVVDEAIRIHNAGE